MKKSTDIREYANDIEEEANKIINRHLFTIENKINDFNMHKKVIKNIDKDHLDENQTLEIQEKIKNINRVITSTTYFCI